MSTERTYHGSLVRLPADALLAAVAVLFLGPLTATADEAIVLEVMAGPHDRQEVVVSWALPESLRDKEHFALTRIDTGQLVPVQVDRNGPPQLAWILREPLPAGQTRSYQLTPADPPNEMSHTVTMDSDGKRLTARVGDKPVLVYNEAVVPSPIAGQPEYARSGYLHPVYNPAGQIVTDDFNPDHAHQHGIMFAWRKMRFEGRATDGWDQLAGLGRVEHVELEAATDGPVFGQFRARLRHVDLTAPGGAKPVLDERWTVKVYDLREHFLFDVESSQACAGDSPVTIEECHYGGMTIRGSRTWSHRGESSYDYLTAEGKNKTDGNQSRPRWVDLFGPIAGETTGVAILSHPGNFRFPQPVRLHPTMPYFCFTPASAGSFTIEPGKPYVSRYRYVVHQGEVDIQCGDRLWTDYAQPPEVRLTKAAPDGSR